MFDGTAMQNISETIRTSDFNIILNDFGRYDILNHFKTILSTRFDILYTLKARTQYYIGTMYRFAESDD